MLKVAFIDAPWPDHGHRTQRWPHKNLHGDINPPPLFQMIAAAAVKQIGHQVRLWDAPAQRLDLIDLLEELHIWQPDLAVVNSSTPSIDHDLGFIDHLRERQPATKTMLVGPHATVFWRELIEQKAALDFIGIGEYDFLIRDLCAAGFEPSGLAGIAYRDRAGQTCSRPTAPKYDLDLLPWPDYSLVELERYHEFLFPLRQRPIATIMTSRGCPFHCSFCLYPQVMFGHALRQRSISNVIAEIQHLVEQYGVRFIYFEDDTFTADWRRVREMCQALIESKVNVSWGCLGRVSGASLDNLKLMRKAGCYLIKFGVESGEQDLLDKARKGFSIDEIEQAFHNTHRVGMYSHATVMFGFPGDTAQTIATTHKFLRHISPDYVQFSICIPFPGTKLYDSCLTSKLLAYDCWEDFDGAWGGVIETEYLTRAEVRAAVLNGYKQYYLRFAYLMKRLYRSLVGPDILSQWLQNIDLLIRFYRRYHKALFCFFSRQKSFFVV